MNREDPKERFAGTEPVKIEAPSDGGVNLLHPDIEEEIEAATREEMRIDEEQKARARELAMGLPSIPQAPPQGPGQPPPDPYTLALLQSMQMTQQALLAFIKGQEESKSIPYHLIKHDTPWNPEGKKDRAKLKRPTFLSGYPVNPMMHSEEEIRMLNEIRPGRYNERKWEVVRFSDDGSIDIRYPNRTIEQRMEMAMKAPTLTVLLGLIISERVRQDERKSAPYDPDDED